MSKARPVPTAGSFRVAWCPSMPIVLNRSTNRMYAPWSLGWSQEIGEVVHTRLLCPATGERRQHTRWEYHIAEAPTAYERETPLHVLPDSYERHEKKDSNS